MRDNTGHQNRNPKKKWWRLKEEHPYINFRETVLD